MKLHQPVIVTDGGPWAEHDQVCHVCQQNSAVLNLDIGIFEPCHACQRTGWRLMMPWTWQRRWWDNVLRKRRKVDAWAAEHLPHDNPSHD